jgi:hypothetical protein
MPKLVEKERLVKVNADESGKRFAVATFVTGFIIFLATFLIAGMAVPSMIQFYPSRDTDCPTNSSNYTGVCKVLKLTNSSQWQATLTNLTEYNAFVSVGANLMRNNVSTLNRNLNRSRV